MRRIKPDIRYLIFSILLLSGIGFLFFVSRWLFFVFNNSLIHISTQEAALALFAGIRFDISSILYLNILIIISLLIPLKLRSNSNYRKGVKWTFITINSIALLANYADIVYYRFTLKRTTADIFSFFSVGGDFDKLIPLFLKDFWYIALIWALMVYLIFIGYQYISKKILIKHDVYSASTYIIQGLIFIFALSLSIIGMRGGFQLRPINIITAGKYAQGNANALVLNTPFTIIQTIGKQDLKPLSYFNETELNNIYSPVHQKLKNNKIPNTLCDKKNIVLIIVESLSMEHVGFYNKKNQQTFTPFIDQLASKSMTFDGISNGKKSIEGIPAIISGIPTLMNTPFISSSYSGNTFESLPEILNKQGYQTAFFHGGTNGTMGFDSYCKAAGFKRYYGKDEYHNSADDDGSWGIWDEPFLQFFKKEIDSFKTPFFASIFTLSSHHPFKIPQKHQGKFPKGKLPIQQTIAYTDYSLSKFFETASKSPWFSNTLFIITADHTSESIDSEYSNDYGQYRIPLIIYDPSHDFSEYSNGNIAQQIDIMPTILAYLNYPKSIFNFGRNLLDTNEQHFAINRTQTDYQIFKDSIFLKFNGESTLAIYNTRNDKALKYNLTSSLSIEKNNLERLLKAFLQQYNNALIYNKMK